MFKLVIIAIGGSVGSILRYLTSGWAQKLANGAFPAGTLFVNVMGCLLIGAAGAFFARPQLIHEEYRVALLVGVLGAFTTFSTFGWETLALANGGQIWLAAVNVILSNSLGLVAVWLGFRVTEAWFGV